MGLLPPLPLDRIHLIGNSSLGGASQLLHHSPQSDVDTLVAQTTIIELNQQAGFENHFTDALLLP